MSSRSMTRFDTPAWLAFVDPLQLLLQVHRGEGGEGIEFHPHIHIAVRGGLVAGGGAEQADAFAPLLCSPSATSSV